MSARSPLWRRLLGFTALPAIAAVSPLLVLPVVARVAGPSGWSSAIAGEAVGTFAAILIAYGWTTIGPALVSIAKDDEHRGRLYRDAIVVRLLVAAVGLPALVVVCWFIAAPGFRLLAVLIGVQGALIAMSFTWFAVGVGDPRSIAFYDAVPRVLASAAAAAVIVVTGVVEIYPAMGILVTIVGTGIYTLRLLRRYPSDWPVRSEVPGLFRMGAPVALNDAALGAYSSVPTPLVNVTASPEAAASYASADKMVKLGQFLPLTLANALQAWIAEVHGPRRSRRIRYALVAHGSMGLVGWVGLAALGPWVSLILFGPAAAAPFDLLFVLGLAFAMYSIRASMTRHVLFPAGEPHAVMRATLIGTVIGVPAMLGLNAWLGPIGAAGGYALTEVIATTLLVRRSRRAIRRLDYEPIIRNPPVSPSPEPEVGE